jgi:hypothetical protein
LPPVAVTNIGRGASGWLGCELTVWKVCLELSRADAPVRCAKLDATSVTKIEMKARASATCSAEARTQLSCFFFMFGFREDSDLERSSLYSPEIAKRSSCKKNRTGAATTSLTAARALTAWKSGVWLDCVSQSLPRPGVAWRRGSGQDVFPACVRSGYTEFSGSRRIRWPARDDESRPASFRAGASR